nr:efflux RND transporter periplasmic adaptor subunit [candidate division Zixibacteria bacterium]
MKKGKKKLLIFGAIAVALIIVIANMLSSGKKLTKVTAEAVAVRDLVEEVSASGWVQPKNRVNITSEVTAEIIAIPVKEGDQVTRGQLLVQLDTTQLKKDFDQYRYSLDETKAHTEASRSLFLQSEEEFNRQKELFERKLISETNYNNAEYSYLNSKYTYEAMVNQTKQAQARYEKAEDNLNKTRVAAPMDGVITYMDAEVGEIAAAQTIYSQGKTLMTISNLSAFEIEVDVDETEIVKVQIGQPARIEVDAFPDTIFAGEVVEIGNTAVISGVGTTEQSTNFKVKVLFTEGNASIRPGMSGTVDITTNRRDDVMAVSYGAIVMRELDPDSLETAQKPEIEGSSTTAIAAETTSDSLAADTNIKAPEKTEKKEVKGVFVVKDGVAKFIPVETGIADQKDIEITSGINKDDMIITGPYRILRTLKSGEEVEISKEFLAGEN